MVWLHPASRSVRPLAFALARAAVCTLVGASGACLPDGPAPLWSLDPAADNPFPDERLQDERGGIHVTPDQLRRFLPKAVDTVETDTLLADWSAQLAGLDGGGRFAPVMLRFSEGLDDETLDPAALAFVSLDGGAAPPVPARAWWWHDPGVLEVQPLSPLPVSSRVGLVVLDTLVTDKRLRRPPDFAAAVRQDSVERADVERAGVALGVSPANVALVVPWRTGDPAAGLRAARDVLRDHAPTLVFRDESGVPIDQRRQGIYAPDQIPPSLGNGPRLAGASRVAVGTFTSLELRSEETDIFDPEILALARPPQGFEQEVILVEPDPVRFPPPWPAVILQHGFGGSNAFVVDNAAPFLARGLAVLGIDASGHGRRGSFTSFFRIEDLRRARDHLRQTAVDHLVLSRLATEGGIDIDGVPGPDLDGTIAYYGHSMGAILGAIFASTAADASAVALNAPGGGMCNVLRSEALQAGLELLMRPSLGVGVDEPAIETAYPILTGIGQPLFEGADPIALIDGDDRPRLLLQLDVGDRLVPNGSTRDLAAAFGVPLRSGAHSDPQGLDALVQLHNEDFGFTPEQNPHGLFDRGPVQDQVAEFVASRGTRLLPAP